ncbi:MAG TPA: hypothetical protein VHA55_02885 [Pseudorhodoplanes sp.]|nr:hypothetical protein [Pseudorhodoplanes sp.]
MTSPSDLYGATPAPKAEQTDLVRRYERIGISAVAGALACEKATARQNPAPVEDGIKERELQVTA